MCRGWETTFLTCLKYIACAWGSHCSTSGPDPHCCVSPDGQLHFPCCLCLACHQPAHLRHVVCTSPHLLLLLLYTLLGLNTLHRLSIKRTNPTSLIRHMGLFIYPLVDTFAVGYRFKLLALLLYIMASLLHLIKEHSSV